MHVNFTKTGRDKVVGEVEYEVECENEGEVKDLIRQILNIIYRVSPQKIGQTCFNANKV